jgi:hypothetical protein
MYSGGMIKVNPLVHLGEVLMTDATRLIMLQVKRYGGEVAKARRRTHHAASRGFTRHRRRVWWALLGRLNSVHQPLKGPQ